MQSWILAHTSHTPSGNLEAITLVSNRFYLSHLWDIVRVELTTQLVRTWMMATSIYFSIYYLQLFCFRKKVYTLVLWSIRPFLIWVFELALFPRGYVWVAILVTSHLVASLPHLMYSCWRRGVNQRIKVFVVVTEMHLCLGDESVEAQEQTSCCYGLGWDFGGEVT